MRLFLICFAIFLAQGVRAQDLPGVSLPASSFDISAVRKWDTIAIPLIPGKGAGYGEIQLEQPSAVWVRFGQRYDESFLQGIHLSLAADGTKLLAAVDLGILKAAGAYEVRVVLMAKGQPQVFNLIFNRPAAKLDAGQTVNIRVVGDAVTASDPLRLKETGNQTSLFDLALQAPSFQGVKGSPLIRFPDSAYTIMAGQVFQADYIVDQSRIGDLRLGVTRGTIDISSPALSAPVTVNFEITRTRPRYWIFILLLAGLAAGWFVRVFLGDKRTLSEKRQEGYAWIVQIKNITAEIKDAVFCAKVKDICDTLKKTLDADAGFFVSGITKLNQLTGKIADAHTAFNDAKKELDDLLKEQQKTAQDISPLFVNNNLSAYLADSLEAAAGYYEEAVGFLNVSNAHRAKDQLITTLDAVKYFAKNYVDPAGHVLALVIAFKDGSACPSGIDAASKEVIQGIATRLETELGKVPAVSNEASTLTSTVQAIDSVQVNLEKLLLFVVEKVTDAFEADYGDRADPDMIAFKKAFDRWKAAMAHVLADPTQIFDKPAVDALSKAWSAQAVVLNRKNVDLYQSVQTPAADAATWPWQKLNRYLAPGMPVALRSIPVTPEEGERRAGNSYLIFSIVQGVFLLLVMSLAAYKYYATSFVGTVEDMLSIFLIAFGTDITIDKVNVWKGNG